MDYTLEVTVNPTHTKAIPAKGTVKINKGLIVAVNIYCQTYLGGTVKAKVELEGTQIYPNVIGEHYTLIERPLEIRDRLPLFPEENDLSLIGWAEGAFYSHRVILRATVLPFTKDMRKVF